MKNTEGKIPSREIPTIWADFNACGLSGDKDDNCYYSLDSETLKMLSPFEGMEVFIYENDIDDAGEPEIFGYVAVLEKTDSHFISPYKARPKVETWYRGPKYF